MTKPSLKFEKDIFIFDLQVLQSKSSFYRGMGRYTIEFLLHLLENNSFTERFKVIFLLNKNLEIDSIQEKTISRLINNYPLVSLPLRVPKEGLDSFKLLAENREILTKYIKDNFSNHRIFFFIFSNFELFHSLATFPKNKNVTKLLLHYDLIPLIFQERYLFNNNTIEKEYFSRFENIFTADHIFTISERTRNDLSVYLNITPKKITSINGGPVTSLNQILSIKSKVNQKSSPLKIEKIKPFILCPTGDDLRKNNINIIKAFAQFSKTTKNKYTLVLTSKFSDESKKALLREKDKINKKAKVVFTGYVSDDLLHKLYQQAELVLFVPLYEGLGFPLLESAVFGKKVVVSNSAIVDESMRQVFYLCDPYNYKDIAEKILVALQDKDFNSRKYDYLLNKFSWQNTVDVFLKTIKKITSPIKQKSVKKNKKIAIVGPNLESYSAIAKYIEQLYSVLHNEYDIDIYYETGLTAKKFRCSYLKQIVSYLPIQAFDLYAYKKYDYVFYNIGNSGFHVQTIKKALVFPGILILHDLNLTGLFNFALHNNLLPKERIELEVNLQDLEKVKLGESLFSLINSSLGIVVHSQFAKNVIRKYLLFDIPIMAINHPFAVNIIPPLRKDKIVVGLAGILYDVKGAKEFLQIIDYFKNNNHLEFKIFGYDIANFQATYAGILQTYKNVHFLTNLSEYHFNRNLESLDILVNYRKKYNGETSRTTLESLRYGVINIVRKIGWFDELPDDLVIKVNNFEQIKSVIQELIRDAEELYKKRVSIFKKSNKLFDNNKILLQINRLLKDLEKYDNPNYKIRNYLKGNDLKEVDIDEIIRHYIKSKN